MNLFEVVISLALAGSVYWKVTAGSRERKAMSKWVNQNKVDLVNSLGPPDQKESDGNEGEIYVYQAHSSSGSARSSGRFSAKTHIRSKMYFITKMGIIYNWKIINR